jgi:peptidyl-prolyl cis-trans isomerase C
MNMKQNNLVLFFSVIAVSMIFLISCQKHSSSPAIARVGKSVLTVDDLKQNIPPEYSSQITMEQNIDYVKQWINTELLYQEAIRKKIDKNKEIKKRLYKMKKDLLAAELISRNSSQNNSSLIDNQKIHAFYELNKENFKREKDIVKFFEIVVTDSRIAWYITKNGTSDNFLTLAAEYSQQPIPDSVNVAFSIIDELQPEIQRAVSVTTIGSISNPIQTELGYHILYIINKLKQGEICEENEIRDDIINQITAKYQKEKLEQLLADLRLKTNITFNSDLIKNVNQKSTISPP